MAAFRPCFEEKGVRMRSFWVIAIVAVPVAIVWQGVAVAAPPHEIATVEGITEYQCDNGFKVLFFPDPSQPKVTVNMTVLVGSRHEGYGEAGMAHLLEHMV